jgi:uncharacterized membrane protein AbrB (regulator of aidB expression)
MSILVSPRMLWMIWDSLHATNRALDIYWVVHRDLFALVMAVWPGVFDQTAVVARKLKIRQMPDQKPA